MEFYKRFIFKFCYYFCGSLGLQPYQVVDGELLFKPSNFKVYYSYSLLIINAAIPFTFKRKTIGDELVLKVAYVVSFFARYACFIIAIILEANTRRLKDQLHQNIREFFSAMQVKGEVFRNIQKRIAIFSYAHMTVAWLIITIQIAYRYHTPSHLIFNLITYMTSNAMIYQNVVQILVLYMGLDVLNDAIYTYVVRTRDELKGVTTFETYSIYSDTNQHPRQNIFRTKQMEPSALVRGYDSLNDAIKVFSKLYGPSVLVWCFTIVSTLLVTVCILLNKIYLGKDWPRNGMLCLIVFEDSRSLLTLTLFIEALKLANHTTVNLLSKISIYTKDKLMITELSKVVRIGSKKTFGVSVFGIPIDLSLTVPLGAAILSYTIVLIQT